MSSLPFITRGVFLSFQSIITNVVVHISLLKFLFLNVLSLAVCYRDFTLMATVSNQKIYVVKRPLKQESE